MNRPLASGSKRSLAAVLVIAAILLAACTTGSAASPSPVGGPAATPAVEAPSATPSANPSPTPAPSVKPAPSPTPVPAAWGKAKQVYKGDCGWLHGGIDAAGGEHAVAYCIGGLVYASSKPNGSWTSQKFTTPENRIEQDPQIAFQGNVAYFAYTRLAIEEGGCGDDGLRDIGVFYRTRTLPSGAWSTPEAIGRADDQLRNFRVDGSTIHAIVQQNGEGPFAYIVVKGGAGSRYPMPNVSGSTSLRIAPNGRAVVAYELNGSVKVATFNGSGFSVETVPGVNMHDPVLVLDGNGKAHVMYARTKAYSSGGGCIDGGDPDPNRGMYYATNASGSWKAERVTKGIGTASFQIDAATGEVRAVIGVDGAVTYYAKASGGTWQSKRLVARDASEPIIARDPISGRIVVLYVSMSEKSAGIYRIAKG